MILPPLVFPALCSKCRYGMFRYFMLNVIILSECLYAEWCRGAKLAYYDKTVKSIMIQALGVFLSVEFSMVLAEALLVRAISD